MRGDGIEGVVQSNEEHSLLLRTLFDLAQSENRSVTQDPRRMLVHSA